MSNRNFWDCCKFPDEATAFIHRKIRYGNGVYAMLTKSYIESQLHGVTLPYPWPDKVQWNDSAGNPITIYHGLLSDDSYRKHSYWSLKPIDKELYREIRRNDPLLHKNNANNEEDEEEEGIPY